MDEKDDGLDDTTSNSENFIEVPSFPRRKRQDGELISRAGESQHSAGLISLVPPSLRYSNPENQSAAVDEEEKVRKDDDHDDNTTTDVEKDAHKDVNPIDNDNNHNEVNHYVHKDKIHNEIVTENTDKNVHEGNNHKDDDATEDGVEVQRLLRIDIISNIFLFLGGCMFIAFTTREMVTACRRDLVADILYAAGSISFLSSGFMQVLIDVVWTRSIPSGRYTRYYYLNITITFLFLFGVIADAIAFLFWRRGTPESVGIERSIQWAGSHTWFLASCLVIASNLRRRKTLEDKLDLYGSIFFLLESLMNVCARYVTDLHVTVDYQEMKFELTAAVFWTCNAIFYTAATMIRTNKAIKLWRQSSARMTPLVEHNDGLVTDVEQDASKDDNSNKMATENVDDNAHKGNNLNRVASNVDDEIQRLVRVDIISNIFLFVGGFMFTIFTTREIITVCRRDLVADFLYVTGAIGFLSSGFLQALIDLVWTRSIPSGRYTRYYYLNISITFLFLLAVVTDTIAFLFWRRGTAQSVGTERTIQWVGSHSLFLASCLVIASNLKRRKTLEDRFDVYGSIFFLLQSLMNVCARYVADLNPQTEDEAIDFTEMRLELSAAIFWTCNAVLFAAAAILRMKKYTK